MDEDSRLGVTSVFSSWERDVPGVGEDSRLGVTSVVGVTAGVGEGSAAGVGEGFIGVNTGVEGVDKDVCSWEDNGVASGSIGVNTGSEGVDRDVASGGVGVIRVSNGAKVVVSEWLDEDLAVGADVNSTAVRFDAFDKDLAAKVDWGSSGAGLSVLSGNLASGAGLGFIISATACSTWLGNGWVAEAGFSWGELATTRTGSGSFSDDLVADFFSGCLSVTGVFNSEAVMGSDFSSDEAVEESATKVFVVTEEGSGDLDIRGNQKPIVASGIMATIPTVSRVLDIQSSLLFHKQSKAI